MKCKDCGIDLDKTKHEWFYCPECWEKRMTGEFPLAPDEEDKIAQSGTDAGQGILKLIEVLVGGESGAGGFLPENQPLFLGDSFWFQSPPSQNGSPGKTTKGNQTVGHILLEHRFFH